MPKKAIDPGAEFSRPDGKSLEGLKAFVRRNPDCTLRGGEAALLVAEIDELEGAVAGLRGAVAELQSVLSEVMNELDKIV